MSKLLPIGTVVRIGSAKDYLIMIMGYYPKNNAGNRYYHYIGCLYPYGIRDADSFILFDAESISEVLFEGYEDEEGESLTKGLPILMKELLGGMEHSVEK